jgi:hypothetical protein
MKVFIVNGCGGSGKTSFELMIRDIAEAHGEKIKILSIIDYVKDVATYFGWSGEKSLKGRKMLCDLKDVMTEYNDIPYKQLVKQIEECRDDNISAVFIDSREAEDIKRLVEDFHALTILVRRDAERIIYGNRADDNIDNYEYDIIIDNSRGLSELLEEASIFYETFIKEEN